MTFCASLVKIGPRMKNNFELCHTVRTVSAKKKNKKNKNKKNNTRELETLLAQGKNRIKNEDFLKDAQNLPLGDGPKEGGWQKFYKKVISYVERVLLSKFGENRMKIEDFLKNAQNWTLGGATGGRGQKLNKNCFKINQC